MFKKTTLALCTMVACIAAPGLPTASAQIFQFNNVVIDGPQAGTTSPGLGTGSFRLNAATGEYSMVGSYAGLQGNVFGAHLHVATRNGPLIIADFNAAGNFSLTGSVENEFIATILENDQSYFNIHSFAFPPGEIRGFLSNPDLVVLGDVNMDNSINFSDISAFVEVLVSGTYQAEADIDGNFVVDLADIPLFIDVLRNQ